MIGSFPGVVVLAGPGVYKRAHWNTCPGCGHNDLTMLDRKFCGSCRCDLDDPRFNSLVWNPEALEWEQIEVAA